MRQEVEKQLNGIVSDRFIELWWDLKLPGLGNRTPTEVFDEDPARLLEYAKAYKEV